MIKQVSFYCLSLVFVAILSGCVTTEGVERRVVDKEKAAKTRVDLGMKYLQSGNRENARRQFVDALELNSKALGAVQGIALVHQMNGEHELAEKNFQKALKMRTKESKSQVRYSYGLFLLKQKRVEEAIDIFEDVGSDLDFRQRPQAIFLKGQCAEHLEQRDRAKASYEHAINLDSTLAPAMLSLAQLEFEDKNYAKSKRLLDRFGRVTRHTAKSLWLGIQIEQVFGNKDKEASYALMLKNMHGYSKEYLEYKKSIGEVD